MKNPCVGQDARVFSIIVLLLPVYLRHTGRMLMGRLSPVVEGFVRFRSSIFIVPPLPSTFASLHEREQGHAEAHEGKEKNGACKGRQITSRNRHRDHHRRQYEYHEPYPKHRSPPATTYFSRTFRSTLCPVLRGI